MATVRAHERELFERAWAALGEIPGVRRLGPDDPDLHAGVVSFVVDGIHPHDVATILDGEGIAVRAGHHCAQPVMQRYDIPATTRASLYVYNDLDDVERLADGVRAPQRLFGVGLRTRMDNLYRDFILEHYREPHNRGMLDPHDLALRRLQPDLRRRAVADAPPRRDPGARGRRGLHGRGCAISQASASIMTDGLRGHDPRPAAGDGAARSGRRRWACPSVRRG